MKLTCPISENGIGCENEPLYLYKSSIIKLMVCEYHQKLKKRFDEERKKNPTIDFETLYQQLKDKINNG